MLDLNFETPALVQDVLFLIFRNNLIEFWIFYHGTNVGASSPKPLLGTIQG
jgi:hypothetical protein